MYNHDTIPATDDSAETEVGKRLMFKCWSDKHQREYRTGEREREWGIRSKEPGDDVGERCETIFRPSFDASTRKELLFHGVIYTRLLARKLFLEIHGSLQRNSMTVSSISRENWRLFVTKFLDENILVKEYRNWCWQGLLHLQCYLQTNHALPFRSSIWNFIVCNSASSQCNY